MTAEHEILIFVHNYFSNKFPTVFDDYYSNLAEKHQINTTNGQNLLHILKHDTNIAASYTWKSLELNFGTTLIIVLRIYQKIKALEICSENKRVSELKF